VPNNPRRRNRKNTRRHKGGTVTWGNLSRVKKNNSKRKITGPARRLAIVWI